MQSKPEVLLATVKSGQRIRTTNRDGSEVRAYPQPLHHVLLLLAVSGGLEDESPRQVSLVVSHEHILVLDILQYHQLGGRGLKSEVPDGMLKFSPSKSKN